MGSNREKSNIAIAIKFPFLKGNKNHFDVSNNIIYYMYVSISPRMNLIAETLTSVVYNFFFIAPHLVIALPTSR